jgi:Tfp pilus assembly protein PilV
MVHHGTRFNIFYDASKVKNNNQGFLLIESLIAILILGIVMAGSLAFYYYSNAVYFRGLHTQMATWQADSEMEQIKNAGCGNTAQNTGSSVIIGKLTGTLKITWPAPPTQDPCLVATTTKPICSSSNVVGVCVTWTEPGNSANSSNVGLVTNVGP